MKARQLAFTLIELMITVVIVAILAAIALPAYQNQIIKGSRTAAQSKLIELANLQEKIYLNSTPGAYSASVSNNYTGQSGGGLGVTNGMTDDQRYSIYLCPGSTPGCTPVSGSTFTLSAVPISTTTQKNDGWIQIDQSGLRTSQYNGNW